MQALWQDLRYGARMLLKQPGFTLIAVVTLSLGIGANTAIFTILNAVMLRTLPAKDPQQLVFLSDPDSHGVHGGQETEDRDLFAYHEFEWLRNHNQVFSGIFAADSRGATQGVAVEGVSQGGEAEPASMSLVSGAYFSVLGKGALLGQTFTEEVDRMKGACPVAVISYSFWEQRLARDPSAVGRKLRIGQTSFDIIGVMPPGFFGETVGYAPNIWVPLTMQSAVYRGMDLLAPPQSVANKYMWLQVMARLKPGVTLEQAKASINLTLQQMLQSEADSQIAADQRKEYLNQYIALVEGSRGASTLRAWFGDPLKILMGMVGLVLLIACANVANLLLARAATREKEMAVRVALGAGRGRLMRQLLTESVLLALLGGATGLLLAQWADALLVRLVSQDTTPIPLDLNPDARILGFTIGVSVLTGILFGLAPAFRAARVNLNSALKGATKAVGGVGAQGGRISAGKLLVVGQVALSLLLLIVAGLFVRSFQRLAQVNPGYEREHLLQFEVTQEPDVNRNADDARAAATQLHHQLLERLQAIPGVVGASLSFNGLFEDSYLGAVISIEGYTPEPGRSMDVQDDLVGPNYFSTAGIPILLGREIGPRDEGHGPRVGVINQTMAHTYFGESNPLGRHIWAVAPYGKFDFVVVGVVADSKHASMWERPRSWFYIPFFDPQREAAFGRGIYEVRVSGKAAALIPAIRAEVKRIAPSLPTLEIHTLNELAARSLTTERMITVLSSFFGLLALLLACVGLYGVMAYQVAGRTSEIGIRLALGAQPRDVFKLIVRQGMALVVIGIVTGLLAARALTHLVATLLYGVTPTDLTTFVAAALLLALVALVACWIPARRATKVDPMIALRCE